MTWWILLACLVAFATKLAGYLLPESLLENRTMVAVTSAMQTAIEVSSVHSPGAKLPRPPPIMSMSPNGGRWNS